MTKSFSRRTLLAALPVAGLLGAGGRGLAAAPTSPYAIDTLTFGPVDLDLRAAFKGGMTGSVVDIEGFPRSEPVARAELTKWAAAEKAPDAAFQIIRQAADFAAAQARGKFAVVLNSQNADILETLGDSEDSRFRILNEFHALGLRVLQLTYNDRNRIGGGYWEDTSVPLSQYGRRLVAEMNKAGVLIDLSHCDEATTLDAIRTATSPVAVTHAGCRALFDNARNKSDTVIRALAEKGGYFGVYNMTFWMTDKTTSSVATICDHIDYVVKLGGVDLVGFGSDHPPMGEPKSNAEFWIGNMTRWGKENLALGRQVGKPPTGHVYAADLNGPDRLLRIGDELGRRGYRPSDVDKILGLNFTRVFQTTCG